MTLLRTAPMQKVRIISLQSTKYELVKALHNEGVLDVRKSKKEMGDDAPLAHLPRISELLVKFKSAESVLKGKIKINKIKFSEKKHLKLEELIKECEKSDFIPEIFKLSDKERELDEEIASIDDSIKIAEMFRGTGIDFSMIKSDLLKFTAFTIEKRHAQKVREMLEKHKKLNYEIIEKSLGKRTLIFIAYEASDANIVNDVLRDFKIIEIDLSNKLLFGSEEKLSYELGKLREKSLNEKGKVDSELMKIASKELGRIVQLREMLEVEVQRASVSIYFKKTQATFCVEGWVAKKRLAELEGMVNRVTKNRYVFEEISPDEGEMAPTLSTRPKWLASFDYMMEFMSIPRSDEIDPTWIFIFSFPIFYGLMVSDVGYGIASFIFAYLLTKVTDQDGLLYHTAKIWQIAAVAAIFFGLLSDQYFGFQLGPQLGLSHLIVFDWFTNVTSVLLLAIGFGLAQVILGLVFGFFNKMHHKEKKLAFSKITSIIAILTGTIAVAGGLFGMFSGGVTVATAIVTVIAIILTALLSGIEATETLNLITHPLSYARLLGFGMASVIIASLIDKWFTPSLAAGPISFVLTLIVFILLHFFNMILTIFEGIVQSARLNFVEFFSKFFAGGGVKFQPFGYRRKYTREDRD